MDSFLQSQWAYWSRFLQDAGCVGCGLRVKAAEGLCPACLLFWQGLAEESSPLSQPVAISPTVEAACHHHLVLQKALYQYKFKPGSRFGHNSQGLWVALLAQSLSQAIQLAHPVALVALPTRKNGGHNTSTRLVKGLYGYLKPAGLSVKAFEFALDWARDTQPQHHLKNRHQRLANLSGAFTLGPQAPALFDWLEEEANVTQKPPLCLLLDDLTTTGATLNEALRPLQAACLALPVDVIIKGLAVCPIPLKPLLPALEP